MGNRDLDQGGNVLGGQGLYRLEEEQSLFLLKTQGDGPEVLPLPVDPVGLYLVQITQRHSSFIQVLSRNVDVRMLSIGYRG